MQRFRWLSLCWFAAIILTSCGKPLPELHGIDIQQWKADRNGCVGNRLSMADTILAQRQKLLSLEELDIVRLLGRPDRNELYRRNQKFYHYFLEPSLDCNGSSDSVATKLVIRFNAVGLSKEVLIEGRDG